MSIVLSVDGGSLLFTLAIPHVSGNTVYTKDPKYIKDVRLQQARCVTESEGLFASLPGSRFLMLNLHIGPGNMAGFIFKVT